MWDTSMPNDYYVADYLSTHFPGSETIAAVSDGVLLLDRTGREITGPALAAVLGDGIDERVCTNTVAALETEGVVSDGNVDRSRLRRITNCAELLSARPQQPENELVATIPDGETSIDETDFGPLLLRLRDLINDAESELFLVTPFFSSTIADRLLNPLENAATRGVSITITTRYLTYGNTAYNRNFVGEAMQTEPIREATSLYEYVRDVDDLGGTVHAKMLLSDDRSCYLGTANITHRGLRDNLELGVIFRDNSVRQFRSLADSLRRSSFMTRVWYQDGDFSRDRV